MEKFPTFNNVVDRGKKAKNYKCRASFIPELRHTARCNTILSHIYLM